MTFGPVPSICQEGKLEFEVQTPPVSSKSISRVYVTRVGSG